MWELDNEIVSSVQSLEIDIKEPVYHLDDYGLEGMMVEHHSLDVSFGSRQVAVSVSHKRFCSR